MPDSTNKTNSGAYPLAARQTATNEKVRPTEKLKNELITLTKPTRPNPCSRLRDLLEVRGGTVPAFLQPGEQPITAVDD